MHIASARFMPAKDDRSNSISRLVRVHSLQFAGARTAFAWRSRARHAFRPPLSTTRGSGTTPKRSGGSSRARLAHGLQRIVVNGLSSTDAAVEAQPRP